MSGADFTWFLAGGYAVEKFVDEQYRGHGDSDIVVFRDEQLTAQQFFEGWELYAADPPGTLRKWLHGEFLEPGIHDIWGHRIGVDFWELQLMLTDRDRDQWIYRRLPQFRQPLNELIETIDGWPCIRVEVQLLYKARGMRPKDQQDFERCLPKLGDDRRERLLGWIRELYDDDHPWAVALETH